MQPWPQAIILLGVTVSAPELLPYRLWVVTTGLLPLAGTKLTLLPPRVPPSILPTLARRLTATLLLPFGRSI